MIAVSESRFSRQNDSTRDLHELILNMPTAKIARLEVPWHIVTLTPPVFTTPRNPLPSNSAR